MADDSEDHMLTTVDNPWNPYTHYDEWYAYDAAKGYDTPGFLARVAQVSLDLSQPDIDDAIESAIDEICQQNITGIYRKASRPVAA